MRFFPSVTFNNTQRKVFLVAGLVFLAAGSLLVARWGGSVTTAAVLCGTGPCTASTANTSISAAQGTVDYNTPAVLTWHANQVENSIPGVNCFGKDEVSPCGTTYQTIDAGNEANAKRVTNFMIGTDAYIAVAINGDNTRIYKWMPETTDFGTSGGLMGQYYNNKNFDGAVLARKEVINFLWSGAPDASMVTDNFSVRWTGTLIAPVTGSYTFTGGSDDGIRVYLDDVLVVDDYGGHAYRTKNSALIPLTAGQKVKVQVDYFENTGNAQVDLSWAYPGQTKVLIPASALYSDFPHPGCFGDGYRCDTPMQILGTGSDKAVAADVYYIGDTPYLALAQSSNNASSKLYKWMTSSGNGTGCFGSGSVCGSPFQDFGATASDRFEGGIKVFAVGSDTFAGVGSTEDNSGFYKWMPTGNSGAGCFGDGTTCSTLYQIVGGTSAKGGWDAFTDAGTTYLALAIDNAGNDYAKLFQWIPDAPFWENSDQKTKTAGSGTTRLDTNWTLDNGKTVTYFGAYSDTAQSITMKVAQWVSGTTYNIVYSQAFSHPGGGWAEFALPSSYAVPSSGTYYLGAYNATAQMGTNNNNNAAKDGDAIGSAQSLGNNGTHAPVVGVRYSTQTGHSCAGDGTHCGFPLQILSVSSTDRSTTGGWKTVRIGSETFLAFASQNEPSRLFKFMTSSPVVESSPTGNTTRGGNRTIFDKSFRLDNGKTVASMGSYSPTDQTAYVKIAKRISATSYNVVVSVACSLKATVWTNCDIPDYAIPNDGAEYYAGLYAPNTSGGTPNNVPVAAYSTNANMPIGTGTVSEVNDNAFQIYVAYTDPSVSITPCLGNGYMCDTVFQYFNTGTDDARYGWDSLKVGTDTYLVLGGVINPSPLYRWMPIARCFGDGGTCGTASQSFDGSGSNLAPAGASLKLLGLNGKAYLASAGFNYPTKLYKGTPIASSYIAVNPSLTASTTRVYWSATNVTSCTVSGPGLSWGPFATTSIATTSKMTTVAPVDGDAYTINCNTTSGALPTKTAYAYVRGNFWDANQVYHDGVWPMESSTCATDGSNYTDCFKGNEFVSKKYGATAIFGAHAQGIGVGTILGYFGGHGPLASQGGGFEYTKTWSGPQFPNPPVMTKPEYYESVVVPSGAKVELEWMCMNDQNQKIQNGCVDEWWSSLCGDSHDSYHAYYSDSTVSSSTLSATNWTGGALYGKRVVTVTQDVTYNLQCVGHAFSSPVTYPVTSIKLYVDGSPDIPPPPWSEPPTTSGCTVYSYDSVNGTTTIAEMNDSPVGGFTTNNLLRNTTFTLSCTIEGGTVEESSIRVLIPPVVSVVSTGNASEPTPLVPSAFEIYLEDAVDYPLTINYTLGGTAVNGTDYQTIPLTATIYPGNQSTTTVIIPIDDLSYEGNETVELTLASGTGYRVVAPVSATTTITDRENAQSLPTGPFIACGGTASSTCELAVYPQQVRLGSQTRVSWYVDGLIKGENGNPGDTCTITASPTGSWSTPAFSIGAGNIWSGGASTTISSRTTFTLNCLSPDGTQSLGVSKTVNIIPSFDEI